MATATIVMMTTAMTTIVVKSRSSKMILTTIMAPARILWKRTCSGHVLGDELKEWGDGRFSNAP